MYSKQVFAAWTPFRFTSVFRLTALLKLEITMLSLAVIVSSFRVTEVNCTEGHTLFRLNVFTAFKETHFCTL